MCGLQHVDEVYLRRWCIMQLLFVFYLFLGINVYVYYHIFAVQYRTEFGIMHIKKGQAVIGRLPVNASVWRIIIIFMIIE